MTKKVGRFIAETLMPPGFNLEENELSSLLFLLVSTIDHMV